MAKTYKPVGYVLNAIDDSGKAKLNAISKPLFEEFKATGKVDAKLITDLAKQNSLDRALLVEYLLELTNEAADVTTNKIKSELKNLYDSFVENINESLENLESSSKSLETNTLEVSKKLDEIQQSIDTQTQELEKYTDLVNTAKTEAKKEYKNILEKFIEIKDALLSKSETSNTQQDVSMSEDTVDNLKEKITENLKSSEDTPKQETTKSDVNITSDLLILQQSLSEQVTNLKKLITNFTTDIASIKDVSNSNVLQLKIFDAINLQTRLITEQTELLKNHINQFDFSFNNIKTQIASTGESIINSITFGIKNIRKSTENLFDELSTSLSVLNPFKRKKKTKDELNLNKTLKKLNTFIDSFFDNMTEFIDKIIDEFIKKSPKIVSEFMKSVLKWFMVNVVSLGILFGLIFAFAMDPLTKAFKKIIDPVIELAKKILKFLEPVRDFLLGTFKKIFDFVLEPFLKGIGSVAEALGKAIGKLVIAITDFFVDTLLPFLKNHLVPVLETILDLIKHVFIALDPWIEPLVNVICATLVEILDIIKRLVVEVGEIFITIVKMLEFPIKFIADFFNGLGSYATRAGEVIGQLIVDFFEGIGEHAREIGEVIGSILVKVLRNIDWALDNLTNLIKLYVIAPLAALQRKFNSVWVDIAQSFKMPQLTVDFSTWDTWHPWDSLQRAFSFGWWYPFQDKLTEEQIAQAQIDEGKPISELVNEEMAKMEEKIAAEKEAMELARLAEEANQEQLKDLLENKAKLDDILLVANNNHDILINMADKLGVKIEQPELTSEELNISASEKNNSQQEFNNGILKYLDSLSRTMTENFEVIKMKLDEKPNLLPIPLPTQPHFNSALMENM